MLNQPEIQSQEEYRTRLKNDITMFENETIRLQKLEYSLKQQIDVAQITLKELEKQTEKQQKRYDELLEHVSTMSVTLDEQRTALKDLQLAEVDARQKILESNELMEAVLRNKDVFDAQIEDEKTRIAQKLQNVEEREKKLDDIVDGLKTLINTI